MVDPEWSHHWRWGGPITGAGVVPCSWRSTLSGGPMRLAGDSLASSTVKHQVKPDWAGSSGVRKKLGELLRWFHESERLAGSVVEAASEAGEILRGVDRQVGALGHVLA